MLQINSTSPVRRSQVFRIVKKTVKRVGAYGVAMYFMPRVLLGYLILGLIDVFRNRPLSWPTIEHYFAGNGVFTWLLSPLNLLMDVLCLPYRNRGVYQLEDLPKPHQDEIRALIDAAYKRDLVGQLAPKLGEKKRGMLFFKWYGKNLSASVQVPEFHQDFKYVRTIGVSIFNKKSSTGEHFGPLRVTLRVLFNINDVDSRNAYIRVGDRTHYWQEKKLFIFDDTLEHQSCNESDRVRYCLFVDVLRPSPWPWLMSGSLSTIRLLMAPVRAVFYKHWTMIR